MESNMIDKGAHASLSQKDVAPLADGVHGKRGTDGGSDTVDKAQDKEWHEIENELRREQKENSVEPAKIHSFQGNNLTSKLETLLTKAQEYSKFIEIEYTRSAESRTPTVVSVSDGEGEEDAKVGKKRKGGKKAQRFTGKKGKKGKGIDASTQAEVTKKAAEVSEGVKDSASTVVQPRLLTGGVLKPYQLEGFGWMRNLYDNGISCILADEMGLGKTVQVIALLAFLSDEGRSLGPKIICAPLATLPNWMNEIRKWCPSLNCLLYHGTKDERAIMRQRRMAPHMANTANFPIIVTSYETCINDRSHLQYYSWNLMILDEGQRVKNKNCRLVRELKLLRTGNRILLSGTPIQNTLEELWSLLNFVNPDVFDDLSVFKSWFPFRDIGKTTSVDDIVSKEQHDSLVTKLHSILRPFLLRRLKKDVLAGEVPPKREIILYAHMTPMQKAYYSLLEKGNLRDTLMSLNVEGAKDISQINLTMNQRKVCQHPYLFGEPRTATGQYAGEANPNLLIQCSGKMHLLDRLLTRLKAGGHKVLIFSQMTSMLGILEDYLRLRKWSYCRLDGDTALADRQSSIDAYNSGVDKELFVFLLSTRAGGLGINLASADTVIIYDSDWNPHQDSQAQDRCHRIGQKNAVVVYRFLTVGSIEIDMMEKQISKKKLERMAVQGGDFRHVDRRQCSVLTTDMLRSLLSDGVASLSSRAEMAGEGELQISDEYLDKLTNRDLIFANVPQYIATGGHAVTNGDVLPLQGPMYDVIDTSVENLLDNLGGGES